MTKYWITKYALTKGILELDGIISSIDSKMLTVNGYFNSFFGKEWHKTKEEAVAQANRMILAKITTLKNQIKILENLKFDQ